MRRVLLVMRAFWSLLCGRVTDEQLEALLVTTAVGSRDEHSAVSKVVPTTEAPLTQQQPLTQSDAITLLAALQREARLIDLIQEPLDNYEDAQVGAAARDVLRDSAVVLERMFALRPVIDRSEGDEVETPDSANAGRFRFVGNVQGEPPYRGRLVHHGWEASILELPRWSGCSEDVSVVAPAELELG